MPRITNATTRLQTSTTSRRASSTSAGVRTSGGREQQRVALGHCPLPLPAAGCLYRAHMATPAHALRTLPPRARAAPHAPHHTRGPPHTIARRVYYCPFRLPRTHRFCLPAPGTLPTNSGCAFPVRAVDYLDAPGRWNHDAERWFVVRHEHAAPDVRGGGRGPVDAGRPFLRRTYTVVLIVVPTRGRFCNTGLLLPTLLVGHGRSFPGGRHLGRPYLTYHHRCRRLTPLMQPPHLPIVPNLPLPGCCRTCRGLPYPLLPPCQHSLNLRATN